MGGHYITFLPHPVYWSHVRTGSQQFQENDLKYGKVYHIGSPEEELDMIRHEAGLMWQAHPRTKGSAGYPDAVRDKAHFLSDRFLGGSFQSLPVDQSQKRLCEVRCLDLMDEMNNWGTDPKYMIAEGDTYMKYPDDETFPQLIVNYVKLGRVPAYGEDWSPIVRATRAGNYFVSSGEVLLRQWGIEGTGAQWPASDAHHGIAAAEPQHLPDSLRCGRQAVGALRVLGFGGQWRVHAAGAAEVSGVGARRPQLREAA
jgi:hypothetical protein